MAWAVLANTKQRASIQAEHYSTCKEFAHYSCDQDARGMAFKDGKIAGARSEKLHRDE